MAFIQLIPQSTVSEGVPTILLPLGLVLLATIFREGYEDRKRHESDRIENARKVLRLCDGQWRACTWADLCVSDLIRIKSNETFPTDTLILNANTSLHEDGRAYVQTTSLDGETNLKMKRACLPVALKSFIDEGNARDAAKELERYVVKCLAPNADVSSLRHTRLQPPSPLLLPSPPPLTSSPHLFSSPFAFRRCTALTALCACQ
jgi:magnesium-transporting ATPase (P-type)